MIAFLRRDTAYELIQMCGFAGRFDVVYATGSHHFDPRAGGSFMHSHAQISTTDGEPPWIYHPFALRHLAVGILAFRTLALLDAPMMRETSAVCQRAPGPPKAERSIDEKTCVRIPSTGAPLICSRCDVDVSAGGPTGYRGNDPICDACLLETAPELGMMLVLTAMARLFGDAGPAGGDGNGNGNGNDDGERIHLEELGAFARVYARYAAERGPTRGLASFLRT